MIEAILGEAGVSDADRCRKLLLFLSGMGAWISRLQPGTPAIFPTALTGRFVATPGPAGTPDAGTPADRV